MDTLFQNFQKDPNSIYKLNFNHQSLSSSPSDNDFINGCQVGDNFPEVSGISPFKVGSVVHQEDETQVERDYFDGVFRYINQMLNEEDLDERNCMFQDCSALQAAEKSFYDVLNSTPVKSDGAVHFQNISDQEQVESFLDPDDIIANNCFQSNLHNFCHSSSIDFLMNTPLMSPFQDPNSSGRKFQGIENQANQLNDSGEKSLENSGNKNSHQREEDGCNLDERRSKQMASYSEETEPTKTYDKALLCPEMQPNFYNESSPANSSETTVNEAEKWKDCLKSTKRGRPRKGEKCNSVAVVDTRDVLSKCAQAISSYDSIKASELLMKIRQYSSPFGDATERLVHYFADALEARLNGTGPSLYTAFSGNKASAADILKAYQTYVTVCPFKRMSNIFANKSIAKQVGEASKVHIIDFGILYGFQWPCIIHGISLRPGGPPKLRITGIDFPQPGFRPVERIERTGERLEAYCKRFNVPFEYTAIAKRWDSITMEDLKISGDEMLVVNCLYRLRHVPDDSLTDYSPRDAVLDMVKKINPDLFVVGVLNGAYNGPYFATRFREAMYHFSSMFDMLETTLPREDKERSVLEREVFGREIMNIVACEGSERIERPETYKQWQLRNQRAGFRQLPLNKKIMKEVEAKVKWYCHREFLLDEDNNWMIQGWKGRVLYALSCWKPLDK